MKLLSCTFLVGLLCPALARGDDLDQIAHDFWAWRAVWQPFSGDDIPRIDRPAGWVPDWSAGSVEGQRRALAAFVARHKSLDPSGWSVSRKVDHRLIGSALARVRWELDIERSWQRNPTFYLFQTLGAIHDRLLQPPPIDTPRSRAIVERMAAIPRTLDQARANLAGHAVGPFTRLAIRALADVRPHLQIVGHSVAPLLAADDAAALGPLVAKATAALEDYRSWLEGELPRSSSETAVGKENYQYFLKQVALIPYGPDQLLQMGRQEWERSVAFETYERRRNQGRPALPLFRDQAAQIEREAKDERAIRDYLDAKGLLTVPPWVKHYLNLPLPDYLQALAGLGVTDDLTSPARLDQDGVSYIRPPSESLGYFALATARDPRPIIVHEGVPGHYFQLVLSWAHENPIRRHYYDSGPNEGIGFYAEEMMLQAGLFDDSPRTREIIYNFMRLRALRVEVDVQLAIGRMTLAQAGEALRTKVPMDRATAEHEAAFFASTPGQAISYQVGKLQIMKLLAEARRLQGDAFDLRAFHDFVWKNGNVPIALQRWELTGLDDEISALDPGR
jgi:uncharacterized protein (DUF885 family)